MYLKSTLLHFTDKHEIGTKYSSSAGQCFWRYFTFFLPKTQELSNNLRLRILWDEEVRVCLSQKMIPTFFLYHSEVWSILHHQSMRPIHWRILLIAFIHCFSHFSVAFHRQLCVSLIFISFLHELSNLRSRILCNQKHRLGISNCQQNCALQENPWNAFIWWLVLSRQPKSFEVFCKILLKK